MQVRSRRHPVQCRHVLATFALLAPVTCAVTASIAVTQKHGFADLAGPAVVSVLVAAALFMPALRHTCTQRGSWIALRRAQRDLSSFALCVSLVFLIALVAVASSLQSLTANSRDLVLDVCFDGMADGATLYCWALAMLPALNGVVRIDSILQKRRTR